MANPSGALLAAGCSESARHPGGKRRIHLLLIIPPNRSPTNRPADTALYLDSTSRVYAEIMRLLVGSLCAGHGLPDAV